MHVRSGIAFTGTTSFVRLSKCKDGKKRPEDCKWKQRRIQAVDATFIVFYYQFAQLCH